MMSERAGVDAIDIPFFRAKRLHKKSRLGCITCIRRRVKCDETHPACTNCRTRGLECGYRERSTSPQTSQALHTTHGEDAVGNVNPSPSSSSLNESSALVQRSSISAGVHEGELARYYLEHTVHTLSSSSIRLESGWVWHVFVPSLAYTSETVRLGMLTLAAIYKHFQEPDSPERRSRYLDVAEMHGELFVAQSRQQLHELHPSYVDSNSACSRLLCVLAFAFYRHHRRTGVEVTDEAAWTWLPLLQGVQTVHKTMIESGQALDPMIMRDMIPEVSPSFDSCERPCIGQQLSSMHSAFDLIKQSQQVRFQALYTAIHEDWFSSNKKQRDDLLAAVDVLLEVTEHICSKRFDSLFRALCTWPGKLSKGFVEMLMTGLPGALIVHSHWLMLVVLAEDLWWVGDMGRAGIHAVVNIVNGMDPNWQILIEWPQRLLGV